MKKHLLFTLAAAIFATCAAFAQDDSNADVAALQQRIDELERTATDTKKEIDFDKIWKKRAKYFNIGYVVQNRTAPVYTPDEDVTLKSKTGFFVSSGKTYYLHKKPLWDMLKFGLDWTWFDFNYAKYDDSRILSADDGSGNPVEGRYKAHQIDLAMQFGASVTVNPVHHLKVSAYFRVSPTYSLMVGNNDGLELAHGYFTFCNAGAAVAWKMLSVGYEYRWGTAKVKSLGMTIPDSLDGIGDAVTTDKFKTKMGTSRIYFGFRF